ncbi:hypothetical protein Vadar_031503 [Vaccinium darrowii]|uniref:Uncharacterized protein n=1 Tax=Vaccinium darrowii TaxID=229202 RepID=A0ACB7YR49_9ERIC|nr:hypothetical protein Vadar_031503 [Vaccinium darrowii]
MAPTFPSIAAWATFLLTKEVKGPGSGLTASLLLDMVNPKVLAEDVYEYLDVYGVYGVTLMASSQGWCSDCNVETLYGPE